MKIILISFIGQTLFFGKLQYIQFLLGLPDPLGLEILPDLFVFQEIDPLVKAVFSYIIKVVHFDQIILREYFMNFTFPVEFLLLLGKLQEILRVKTFERCCSVVNIIAALAQIKIEDVYGDNLDYLRVRSTFFDMFCYNFRGAEHYPLEIIEFPVVLDLNDDNLFFIILYFQIHPVKLILAVLLVAFTFEQLKNTYIFSEEFAEKTFKYLEVGFAPQQLLHCPVKTDQFPFRHFITPQ